MSKLFHLFVYGTLRSGYANHDRYCREKISIYPAITHGKLYDLPYGYPALKCPPSYILWKGSNDISRDLDTQNETAISQKNRTEPIDGFTKIYGQVLSFLDPEKAIPPIDRLEGFSHNGNSLYTRVLIPVYFIDHWSPVWAFEYARSIEGPFLPNGIWNSD